MADERIYYVLCADNCKFESMTKEQILAAIEQAVSTGEIKNVDTGFVTRLKEQNANKALTFWVGTTAEYNAIPQKVENCFYILTDDTTAEDINTRFTEFETELTTHGETLSDHAAALTTLINGKEFLNVKDYGAKGDGATDDYEAISNLLTKYPKANLYFPAGKYLISDTLDITSKKTLRGSGNTTIAYTGEDLLLHISGDYLNKPTIEQLNFTSSANTLFLSCKRANNTWGGSFVMRDCKIVGFNHTIMRFNSAYHVELNNLIIQSNGMFVFTTTDGTTTESNFSNSINFTNVHHSLLDKNTKPSILFDIQNVRQIMFYNCQFHDCTTLMQGTTAKEIHFINTWFERIENIYKFDSASDKPKMTNCRYVEMKKFNGNSVVIDENRGEKHIEIFATENEYTPNLLNDSNEEILFSQVEIFNAKDTYAKFFYPYKFTSKAARIYLPFNCVKKTENDADTLSYELKRIISYAHQYCDFEIIAICDYPDNTKTIVKQKVVTAESDSNPSAYRFYAASAETFFKGSTGDAKDYTANLSTDVNGRVTLSTNVIAETLTLLIKFNILGGI